MTQMIGAHAPAPARPRLNLRLLVKRLMWPGTNWVSRDKAKLVHALQRGTPERPIRTLDCGCGNAYFTYEAARRGSTCLGITIHDWERRSCEEMRDYLGVGPDRMDFRTARLEDLARDPARRGTFDQVLFLDVVEHIRDARAALGQIRELLNEDGLVYISTPDRDYQGNFPTSGLRITRVEDGWHVRNGLTFEGLEKLLEESGFEPVDRLRFGTKGSTAVTWIQHNLFGRHVDTLTVALFPMLKGLAMLLSPWRDNHTVFVLARKV